jgi:hypothetical protein
MNRFPAGRASGGRTRAAHCAPVLVAVLLASVAAGCSDTGLEPTAPLDGFAALGAPAKPELVVQVKAPDGVTLVKNATVRVYGKRTDGSVGPVATALTNALGKATFALPKGGYCVSVRYAPPEWLALDIVTPPEPFAYAELPFRWGPVVRTKGGWEDFTPAGFESCYTKLPIDVSGPTFEVAKLTQGFVVQSTVLGLDGKPLSGIDVFAVIPVDVPWATPPSPDVQLAFFSFVDRTASPAALVVAPGSPYALEFQVPYQGFNLTGTFKGNGGAVGGGGSVEMEAAPLMCLQTTEHFPAGEPGIDFLQVNYGYHASLALELDRSIVSTQFRHNGNGGVTVTFRTDVPQGRWQTTLEYACTNGVCTVGRIRTNGGGNKQTVQAYFAPLGDGMVKATVVLGGVPSSHARVLFAAKANRDAIPLPSRDKRTDAYFEVPRPDRCIVQLSNDDKWSVGEI